MKANLKMSPSPDRAHNVTKHLASTNKSPSEKSLAGFFIQKSAQTNEPPIQSQPDTYYWRIKFVPIGLHR